MSWTKAMRGVCGILAAYALVLHALVMSAATAPQPSTERTLVSALQELCSGRSTAGPQPGLPGTTHHAPPCALCGLGHATVDLPGTSAVAPPTNIVETLALAPPAAELDPRFDRHASARPRAPPAFV